ncbi:MAG: iron-containing alcohol dehydrogenase, partial [Gammaproteobacteria bacterium]
MIPFGVQVAGYQSLMKTLKGLVKTLPFPKPTLFTGPGSSLELCEAVSLMGVRKLLIVTDAMLVKIGLLDEMEKRLETLGIRFVVYDGILPDPTIDQIEAGLKILKRERCQAILAVGGGSPIDAAKVIAARATNKKPVSKMEGMFKVFSAPLPLFAVPTTAGTGSEVTIAAVVSDPGRKKKSAIMDPKLVPMMAALDGSLMTGLPPNVTAATGMDALTHAVEAYISANALPETDAYALAATRLIMENLPTAVATGKNVEARQSMAFASYYAALAFTRAGVGYVHAISHNFGAYYHTPHGLGNAIV